ncbi:MAG: TraB/GumN family protein, partial [Prevotella sp.]|nr:TraB/GumN family protein [Prevotella sp.]
MKKRTLITVLLFMAAILTTNAQFIFRISGNGSEKPSYILGTCHVLSGDLLDSIPAFLEAENQCQQLFVESDVTDPQNKEDRRAESQQLMSLPDGKTISDILGEEKMT